MTRTETNPTPLAVAVNAWAGDENGEVWIAIREDQPNYWKWHRLTRDQGIQLADQLRLLTHSTD